MPVAFVVFVLCAFGLELALRKAKFGLRQFSVRGLSKVRMEALWACLTYNICVWMRLRWRQSAAVATAAA